jgi:hypothetical protein
MPKFLVKGVETTFRKRTAPLEEGKALALIQKHEVIEAPSVTALGEALGWERSRTGKALPRWMEAGLITVEDRPRGGKLIRALPAPAVTLREFGPGENREREGKKRREPSHVKRAAEPRVRSRSKRETERELDAPEPREAERERKREFKSDPPVLPKTYEDKGTAVSAPDTVTPVAENTSTESASEVPPATHSSTPIPREISMGLFARKSKPEPPSETLPEPPAEPAPETREPAGDVTTGKVPAKAEERTPKPYVERPRWRLLGRSGRVVERKAAAPTVTVMPPPRKIRRSYMLCLIGIGFLALSISINIWNARSYNGDPWDMAIPASLGILCELALFYLPSHLPNVGWGYKFLIVIALAGVTAYALTNSLKMSSILAADQAQARADRQTAGVQTAAKALADARAARATSCRRKEDKSKACTAALADVEKLEKAQAKATTEVALAARPENTDFSNLVSWLSGGNVRPGANDFSMLWLFLRTVLPQIGGLIFMVGLARR